MNKHLVRLFSLLLIPALMADPVTAAGLAAPWAPHSQALQTDYPLLSATQPRFEDQALTLPIACVIAPVVVAAALWVIHAVHGVPAHDVKTLSAMAGGVFFSGGGALFRRVRNSLKSIWGRRGRATMDKLTVEGYYLALERAGDELLAAGELEAALAKYQAAKDFAVSADTTLLQASTLGDSIRQVQEMLKPIQNPGDANSYKPFVANPPGTFEIRKMAEGDGIQLILGRWRYASSASETEVLRDYMFVLTPVANGLTRVVGRATFTLDGEGKASGPDAVSFVKGPYYIERGIVLGIRSGLIKAWESQEVVKPPAQRMYERMRDRHPRDDIDVNFNPGTRKWTVKKRTPPPRYLHPLDVKTWNALEGWLLRFPFPGRSGMLRRLRQIKSLSGMVYAELNKPTRRFMGKQQLQYWEEEMMGITQTVFRRVARPWKLHPLPSINLFTNEQAQQAPYKQEGQTRIGLLRDTGIYIALRESLFAFRDIPARNQALAWVTSHEIAEWWLKEHAPRMWVRLLHGFAVSVGVPKTDLVGQQEFAANLMAILPGFNFYGRLLKETQTLVEVPAVRRERLLEEYQHFHPIAPEGSENLINLAYRVARDSLGPNDAHFVRGTRDALTVLRMHQGADAVAATLLMRVPDAQWPQPLHPHIVRMIQVVRELLTRPSRYVVLRDQADYTVQNLTRQALQIMDFGMGDDSGGVRPPASPEDLAAVSAIFLADRLQALGMLPSYEVSESQAALIEKTLLRAAPLANWEGYYEMARELRNLAWMQVYPDESARLREEMFQKSGLTPAHMEEVLDSLIQRLQPLLAPLNPYILKSRQTVHRYSEVHENANGHTLQEQAAMMGLVIVVNDTAALERIRREDLEHRLGIPGKDPSDFAYGPQGQSLSREDRENGELRRWMTTIQFSDQDLTGKPIVVWLDFQTESAYEDNRPEQWQKKTKQAIGSVLGYEPEDGTPYRGQQFPHEDPTLRTPEGMALPTDRTARGARRIAALQQDVRLMPAQVYIDYPAHPNGTVDLGLCHDLLQTKHMTLGTPFRTVEFPRQATALDWLRLAEVNLNPADYEVVRIHPKWTHDLDPETLALEESQKKGKEGEKEAGKLLTLTDEIKTGDILVARKIRGKKLETEFSTSTYFAATVRGRLFLVMPVVNEQSMRMAQDGKKFVKDLYGDLNGPDFETKVLEPALRYFHLETPNEFFGALGLAQIDRGNKQRAENSPFISLEEEFGAWYLSHFIFLRFNVRASADAKGDQWIVEEFANEDQIGVLAETSKIANSLGLQIRSYKTKQGRGALIVSEMVLGRSAEAKGSLEAILHSLQSRLDGIRRHRDENLPSSEDRRVDVVLRNGAPSHLFQLAEIFAKEKINLVEADTENGQLALTLTLPPHLMNFPGQPPFVALSNILDELNLVQAGRMHLSPISPATVVELDRLLRTELRSMSVPEPEGLVGVSPSGAVDQGFLDDIRKALTLLYDYEGHPDPWHPSNQRAIATVQANQIHPSVVRVQELLKRLEAGGRAPEHLLPALVEDVPEVGPKQSWSALEVFLRGEVVQKILDIRPWNHDKDYFQTTFPDLKSAWQKRLDVFKMQFPSAAPLIQDGFKSILEAPQQPSTERDVDFILAGLKNLVLESVFEQIEKRFHRDLPFYPDLLELKDLDGLGVGQSANVEAREAGHDGWRVTLGAMGRNLWRALNPRSRKIQLAHEIYELSQAGSVKDLAEAYRKTLTLLRLSGVLGDALSFLNGPNLLFFEQFRGMGLDRIDLNGRGLIKAVDEALIAQGVQLDKYE